MSEFKELLFIINKHSGTGFESHFEDTVVNVCKKSNASCQIEYTNDRGHATELAKQGVGKYDVVVAVGGDGTVNETARGLVGTTTRLGIIPKGSGNGLARHLNIPIEPEQALEALFRGIPTPIDTFTVNGQLSVNVSGIGFDGHIANLFSERKRRGFWGYLPLILREYFTYQEFPWELSDGSQITHRKSFMIAVANSSQYGNDAFVAPNASVGDGLLDVAITNKIPLYRAPSFAYKLFNRKLQSNDLYKRFTARDITIRMVTPCAFHVDGEPGGHSDFFSFHIMPGSLNLILPANPKYRV
jgi:diacylglycerol kinase (ATP)